MGNFDGGKVGWGDGGKMGSVRGLGRECLMMEGDGCFWIK